MGMNCPSVSWWNLAIGFLTPLLSLILTFVRRRRVFNVLEIENGCWFYVLQLIIWLLVVCVSATPQDYSSGSAVAKPPATSTQRTRYVVYYRPTASGSGSSATSPSSVTSSTDGGYKESDTIPTRQYIQVQQPSYSGGRQTVSFGSEDTSPVRYTTSGSYRSPAQYQQLSSQDEKPDYSQQVNPQVNQVQTTRYYVTRPSSASGYQSTPSSGQSDSGRQYAVSGGSRYVSSPEGASYVRVPQVAEQQLSYQTQQEGEDDRGQSYTYAPAPSGYQGSSSGRGYSAASSSTPGYGGTQGEGYPGSSQGEGYQSALTGGRGYSGASSSAYGSQGGSEGYGGGAAGLQGSSEDSYGSGGHRGVSGLHSGGYRGSSSAYSGAPESSYGTSALQGYGESDGGRYQGLSSGSSGASGYSSGSGIHGGLRGQLSGLSGGGYRGSSSSFSPAQLQGSSSSGYGSEGSRPESSGSHGLSQGGEGSGQSSGGSSRPRAPGFPDSFRPPTFPFELSGGAGGNPFQFNLQGGQEFGNQEGGASAERPFHFGIQGLASSGNFEGGEGGGHFGNYGAADEQFAASNQGGPNAELNQGDLLELLRTGAANSGELSGFGHGGFNPFGAR